MFDTMDAAARGTKLLLRALGLNPCNLCPFAWSRHCILITRVIALGQGDIHALSGLPSIIFMTVGVLSDWNLMREDVLRSRISISIRLMMYSDQNAIDQQYFPFCGPNRWRDVGYGKLEFVHAVTYATLSCPVTVGERIEFCVVKMSMELQYWPSLQDRKHQNKFDQVFGTEPVW